MARKTTPLDRVNRQMSQNPLLFVILSAVIASSINVLLTEYISHVRNKSNA